MSVPVAPRRVAPALGLLLVLLLFCVPLFVHLGKVDMENDESGYSYAVDRILETHNWMTPRSSPDDNDFVEKPPLMFWIVAGSMKVGLLPHNDFGMRFYAALFGSLGFVYVYLLGCRLHGPLAGVVAGLVLFTFNPLLYDHGLRTNNMEAPLFLSYCAGMFHFIRWIDAGPGTRARGHAYGAAAAFVLGFMTKFVAAGFLPMLWILAVLGRDDRAVFIRTRWREWIGPSVLATLLIVPWFVYQTVRMGSTFWHIIVGQHIYERFTTGLDPSHLRPWSFYFTQTWHEFSLAGSEWAVLIGLGFLVIRAVAAKGWLARLMLAWAVVPMVLISVGSSKLSYYADPFLPPMALGAGWIASIALTRLYAGTLGAPSSARRRWPVARTLATLAGFIALAMAVWTFYMGRFSWTIMDVTVFGNASVLRPLIFAAVLMGLGGQLRAALPFGIGVVVLLLPFPLWAYMPAVQQTAVGPHPLRAIRDCARAEMQSGTPLRNGTYFGADPPTHTYFFYLRSLGPYLFRQDGLTAIVGERLFAPDQQSLVVLSENDYRTWEDRARAMPGGAVAMPPAVRTELGYLVVMPGRLQACVAPALAAGGGDISRISFK